MKPRLPEDVVLHKFPQVIFSDPNLTNRQAVQYGLVSKDFLAAMQKRPVLNLDWSEFLKEKKNKYKKYWKELEYVHSTLKRYHEEKIHLESFTFNIRHYHDPRYCEMYDECIDWSAEKNLKNLNLSNLSWYRDASLQGVLPESVFRVESLVQLRLMGWDLMSSPEIVTWPNLKKLCLDEVGLGCDEEIFEGLLRNCPLLEHLEIHRTFEALCTFRLSHLLNLKHLTIVVRFYQETIFLNAPPNLESASFILEQEDNCGEYEGETRLLLPQSVYRTESLVELRLERCKLDIGIDTDREEIVVWPDLKRLYLDSILMDGLDFEYLIDNCPSLENLEIHSYFEPLSNPGYNLQGFQNLKVLYLDRCEGIDESFFTDFANQFPRLEELCLQENPSLKAVCVSSPSIRRIKVVNLVLLKEVKFDLPSVAVFEFEAHYKTRFGKSILPKLSVTANLDNGYRWKSVIKLGSSSNLGRQLNQELKQFMTALNGSKITLLLS